MNPTPHREWFLERVLGPLFEPILLSLVDWEEEVDKATSILLVATLRFLAKVQREYLDARRKEALLPDQTTMTFCWKEDKPGLVYLESVQKAPMIAENVVWISKRTSHMANPVNLQDLIHSEVEVHCSFLLLLPTVQEKVERSVYKLIRHKLDYPHVLESIS